MHPRTADEAAALRAHAAARRIHNDALLAARLAVRSPGTSTADVHAALRALARAADAVEHTENALVAAQEAARYAPRAA